MTVKNLLFEESENMIVTSNWLKEFVDFDLSPKELADLLTMQGLEVEGMEIKGEGMDEVVVAVVQEKAQHPNADKLSLCKVNNGTELLNVVCGAQNFKVGDKVALAQIGAVLPGNFRIKRSKIRGEESCGMLCSEKELELADESEGIMILPPTFKVGTPLFSALGFKDTVYEIGLTPNRADCLSVIGIAREVAAKLGKKVRYPGHTVKEKGPSITAIASVVIDDPYLCPRYTARYVSGCTIAPSPSWLVNRLNAVGMRSVNNVVDVTNYVLMEYGHPLHAFDFKHLNGGRIVVRRAADGERFATLDGQDRLLKSSDLVIRDGEKAVALAGIMGGGNSEISDATTDILLESAYFNPTTIRLTSKRLGLHTESSHRFERGTDIHILTKAIDRAASLIAELAGGSVAHGILDVYPLKSEPKKIRARVDRINSILGINLTGEDIRLIFHNLEFAVDIVEPGIFDVYIPSFRVDIEREIDLIEEIARLNGYDKIPATMPKARVFYDRPAWHQRVEKRVRDLLVSQGMNEIINFSFIGPDACDKLLLDKDDLRCKALKLLNPLLEEQSVMRTTLLPGLLETAARNASFRILNQRIFEMRRVYLPRPERELPDEPLHIGGLLTGMRYPDGWNQEKFPVDFYDAKGVVENILSDLNIQGVSFEARDLDNFFHPGKACNMFVEGDVIGSVGEIHPTVQENYGLEKTLFYFVLNLEKLVTRSKDIAAVSSPPRFPDTFRDIAMLLADETPAAIILTSVNMLNIPEIEGVEVFDQYKGEHVPSGQKSIAIRIRYRSSDRTLTDDEVTGIHQKVIDNLSKKINISIR